MSKEIEMDVIKALKENEKPFNLMTIDMQLKAVEIKPENFELRTCGKWVPNNTLFDSNGDFTYRLRPDYEEPEQGIERCPVIERNGRLWYERGYKKLIIEAPNYPDFIGFEYEETDMVYSVPRMYKSCTDLLFGAIELKAHEHKTCKVLTPTAVLFRRSK